MDSKSVVCMSNNGKDTNNTSHITRRLHFMRNCEKCRMHNIDWREGGPQSADIVIKHVGDNDLNPRMKYIIARINT